MRQIDADEGKQRIIAFATGCHTTYLTVDNIVMLLNQSPTVDAVPVVHGRWVPTPEYDSCRCSGCKHQYTGFFASHWNYCPNCGAKMDGERKDND